MNKRSILITLLVICFLSAGLFSCTEKKPEPSAENFQIPTVTLKMVEVAHYWGWWYYSSKVEPTVGKAGENGAPLDLAFIYDIENPNPYPVLMDGLKFTVAFEEFDLNTVGSPETMWIPGGKTNQVRVHAMFDGRQSLLSLLVVGGFQLKEKVGEAGSGAALKQLGKWWEEFPEFTFPIHVKEGSAIFKADGLTKVATFSAKYPK